jgi:membrane-associated phospholipid phosphatase
LIESSQRVPQRLVPARFRPVALGVLGVCLLTVIVLGALFFHGSRPSALDSAVDNQLLPGGFGGYGGFGRFGPGGPSGAGYDFAPLARLGGPGPITLFTALLAYCCLAMRRYRGAIMLVAAVIVASGLTEFVLKPLVHRTYFGSLTFPSGHATATFALIACIVILLLDPPGSVLPTSLRLVLSLSAIAVGCAVALGLVAAQDHYFTDTIGGAAVGTGVTLAIALGLDRLGTRREQARAGIDAPAEPARVP